MKMYSCITSWCCFIDVPAETIPLVLVKFKCCSQPPLLAAKDRNLHPVAILNSAARTTRWTGTASEKNAQFRRAKFEKQS